jgi:hypothetical protein
MHIMMLIVAPIWPYYSSRAFSFSSSHSYNSMHNGMQLPALPYNHVTTKKWKDIHTTNMEKHIMS